MDLENLANKIFNDDVKPPKSITVSFENLENIKELFEVLLLLFTRGMRMLFGRNGIVKLDCVSEKDFFKMIRYFYSIGIKLIFHKFHIQQIQKMENEELMISGKKLIQYIYRVENPVTDDFLEKNYPEKPHKNLLTDYKKISSDKLIDYKYKIRVKDNIYIIYFDYL